MYNDFVIIGPKSDPAGIKGKDINAADGRRQGIRAAKALFMPAAAMIQAPTKKKNCCGKHDGYCICRTRKESWYVQTGQGMLATINMCAQESRRLTP